MSMEITLQAGVYQEFFGEGNFFRLMEAADPLTVEFFHAGREVAEAVNIAEGYAEKFEAGRFDRVRLRSATTQAVQFVTRLGNSVSYDKAPVGDINIVGMTPATLDAMRLPMAVGQSWTHTHQFPEFVAVEIFNAAANPRGAVIHCMESNDQGPGYIRQTFLAKATTPLSSIDGLVLAQSLPSAIGSTVQSSIRREVPIRITAGLGLYFASSMAGEVNMLRTCVYTLL